MSYWRNFRQFLNRNKIQNDNFWCIQSRKAQQYGNNFRFSNYFFLVINFPFLFFVNIWMNMYLKVTPRQIVYFNVINFKYWWWNNKKSGWLWIFRFLFQQWSFSFPYIAIRKNWIITTSVYGNCFISTKSFSIGFRCRVITLAAN